MVYKIKVIADNREVVSSVAMPWSMVEKVLFHLRFDPRVEYACEVPVTG